MQFQSMHFDHNNGEVRQRISWIRDMHIRSSASSAPEQEISKQNYIPSRMLKYKGSWKVKHQRFNFSRERVPDLTKSTISSAWVLKFFFFNFSKRFTEPNESPPTFSFQSSKFSLNENHIFFRSRLFFFSHVTFLVNNESS